MSKPGEKEPISIGDINSLIDANTKVAGLLEKIQTSLEPLKRLENIERMLEHEIVNEIREEAIEKKGLDISHSDSKISKEFLLIHEVTKEIRTSLNRVIMTILLGVSLLGGIRAISDWYFAKHNQTTTIEKPIETQK